jgi:ketosteroid isomerase-like protein
MSQENVEIVRRIWHLWSEMVEKGDTRVTSDPFDEGLLASDSTFTPIQDVPGSSGKTYVGRDGLREFVRAWAEDWDEWRITLEEVVEASKEHVVAVVHQSAVGKSSRAPVSLRFAMVFTFRDGQVVNRRDYRDRAEALETLGLSE